MRYMVKCAYCEKTFVVDTNMEDAEFICESCGGKSGKENIVQEIVPQKKIVYKSSNRAENESWDAIKSFDVSEHEGKEGINTQPRESFEEAISGGSTSNWALFLHAIPFIVVGIICVIVYIYLKLFG